MLRNVALFLALFLVSLTAGRAFWVVMGENPLKLSAATYIEFFQKLDKGAAVPIAITGIGGALFAGISAFLHRQDRVVFGFLLLACVLTAISCLVTISVNVPINNQIATFNPASPPDNYLQLVTRWWHWHQVRCATLMPSMVLLCVAALIRKQPM